MFLIRIMNLYYTTQSGSGFDSSQSLGAVTGSQGIWGIRPKYPPHNVPIQNGHHHYCGGLS